MIYLQQKEGIDYTHFGSPFAVTLKSNFHKFLHPYEKRFAHFTYEHVHLRITDYPPFIVKMSYLFLFKTR